MSVAANRQLLERVFADLSAGNTQAFLETLADDVRWTISGTTAWSGTYQGKEAVLTKVFVPVFSQYAEPYRATATRFVADDEHVVVEARGGALTKSGKRFDNSYCYVFHLPNGVIDEVVEYFDTLHATQILEPPRGD